MKNFILILFVIAISLGKPNTTHAQMNTGDSLALVDLYNSTDGAHWAHSSGWLTTTPVKDWYGINSLIKGVMSPHHVVAIDLQSNNLTGTIPHSIGSFQHLTYLNLSHNKLGGAIPYELPQYLNVLEVLNLSYNQLNNIIPKNLGFLHKLYYLNLSNNRLTGWFHGRLHTIGGGKPVTIDVSHNNLTGRLRRQIGFGVYRDLDFSYNQFYRHLPVFYHLNGYFINFSHNLFSGKIPASLGNDNSLSLDLDLSYNQFSGNIPASLGGSSNIEELNLSHNQLIRPIPSSFGNHFFYILDLSYNQLSGNITNALSMYSPEVKQLNLSHNQFTGKIPATFTNIHWYNATLDLSFNNLRDTIPANLFNEISSVVHLNLSHNNLVGKIPSSFGNLYDLQSLHVGYNKLQGTVPAFPDLLNLKIVGLLHNNFTFDGIEQLAQQKNFDTLKYDMQRKIDLHENGNILSVYAGGTLSNNTYRWYKDGTLTATKTGDSTLTLTQNGSYNVLVTNSIATALTLYSDTIVYSADKQVPQTITASSQKNNKLNDDDKNVISVYPNPANSKATILFNATGKYTIELTDISGKLLQTKTGVSSIKQQNIIQLNVSNYAPGIYLITITDEKNNKQSLKLNKE